MASIPDRTILDLEKQLERMQRSRAEQERWRTEQERWRTEHERWRIEQDKFVMETRKIAQDTKLATPQMFFQGALAMAALIGAGAALAKLFS